MHRIALILLLLAFLDLSVRAVEIDTAGTITYNNKIPDDPTNPSGAVAGWDTGWSTDSNSNLVTGWSYVGQVNGASAVYLGNGWILTAGHVGENTFTLKDINGVTQSYSASGPNYSFTTTIGATTYPADLSLFKVSASAVTGQLPDLPVLTLAMSPPVPATNSVVMIGYGGGQGETWGQNTVSASNQYVQVTAGPTYVTDDFSTAWDSTGVGNKAVVVGGDSGGGDFIYNTVSGKWELAGFNEAVDNDSSSPTYNTSYLVQLNAYRNQINAIVAPEPGTWALLILGLGLLGAGRCLRPRQSA